MIASNKHHIISAATRILRTVTELLPYYSLNKNMESKKNLCQLFYFSSQKIKNQDKSQEKEKVKVKAEVASAIIRKIADAKINIKEQSLRQSIIQDINKANELYPSAQLATQLLPIFKGGVQLPRQIYSQQRIDLGSNSSNQATMFCPTLLVSQQIFQRCLKIGVKCSWRPEIFYGLFGTSKTFSFILYGLLSGFVSRAAYKNLIAKQLFVPKLIYFNIRPENLQDRLSTLLNKYNHIIEKESKLMQEYNLKTDKLQLIAKYDFLQCLYSQCPELSYENLSQQQNREKLIANQDYKKYQQKGIETILLVDQINTVASYLRRKMNGSIQSDQDQRINQFCTSMNKARKGYTEKFSKIILNSSYNFQFYDKEIVRKVGVTKDEKHTQLNQRNFGKLAYLERFNARPQQTLLSLTDMILFNIEDMIQQPPKTINGKEVRQIVYDIIWNNKDQMFVTPLAIRNYLCKIQQNANKKQAFVQSLQNVDLFTEKIRNLVTEIIKQAKDFYKIKIKQFLDKDEKFKKERKGLLGLINLQLYFQDQNSQSANNFQLSSNKIKRLFAEPMNDDQDSEYLSTKLKAMLDGNLFYLDESLNLKPIIPIQYLHNLIQFNGGYLQDLLQWKEQYDITNYCEEGTTQGNILQKMFFAEVIYGKNIQIKANNSSVQIKDQVFGMKPFNKQLKNSFGIIERLEAMFKIMKENNIYKQGSYLIIPIKQQSNDQTVYMTLLQKKQMLHKLHHTSKAIDFMIISINTNSIQINVYDITKNSTLKKDKIAKLNQWYNDYIKNNKNIMIGQTLYELQVYFNIVGLGIKQKIKNEEQKKAKKAKRANQKVEDQGQNKVETPQVPTRYIEPKDLIQVNTSKSKMNGVFKKYAQKLEQKELEKKKKKI